MNRIVLLSFMSFLLLMGCAREVLPPPTPSTPTPPADITPTVQSVIEMVATPESAGYPEPVESYPAPPPVADPYPAPDQTDPADEVATTPQLTAEVLAEYPHDSLAWTQGLLWYEGDLYESTGEYGKSTLRRVDLASGTSKLQIDLDPALYGEGLTLVDDRLIQLTWKEQVAIVYDRETFEEVERFSYQGEGWGICYDGEFLWMSNGSDRLTKRDAQTFEPLSEIRVTQDGLSISRLNELECVNGRILSHIWFTDQIIEIDPQTGNVTANINLFDLLTPEERADLETGEVLNGIAYNPEKDVYFVTGKHWPKLFEVRFVPAAE